MAITVNTNIPSLTAQKSMNNATTRMNTAMERMTTGLKINSSKDDAAGMAVANKLDYKISSLNVAQNNGQMGTSMLDTAEGVLNVINDNLVRIRDLTEQAANGTYGSDAMTAIETEVQARMDEITRLAQSSEFNGKILFNPDDKSKNGIKKDITLQVGIKSDESSQIKLSANLFKSAAASALFKGAANVNKGDFSKVFDSDENARTFLTALDTALADITSRTTLLGGYQQRIISAMDAAGVMETNLTSAKSLIEDADIAEESSNYIKQQILQQTSASLLATANQAPSIALNLV
ncbi:MAG: flagellin FliC [Candidatus Melainabacteria bacterium]|nr:MAG: flagellin FliC [Candidatus Melainabacteria bacterium]